MQVLYCGMQAQHEVDDILGSRQQPDMQDYTKLKYVMRCVNESMRLYPHPPVLLRRAMIQDELPGTAPCLSSRHSVDLLLHDVEGILLCMSCAVHNCRVLLGDCCADCTVFCVSKPGCTVVFNTSMSVVVLPQD